MTGIHFLTKNELDNACFMRKKITIDRSCLAVNAPFIGRFLTLFPITGVIPNPNVDPEALGVRKSGV